MRTGACLLWLAAFVLLIGAHDVAVAQYPWTKDAANPVVSGGGAGAWDNHCFMPSVLWNADSNRYEMWYGGSFGPPAWRPYRIGFATSRNGVTWTRYAGNPVFVPDSGSWDGASTEEPCVIRENGIYKMWYTGLSSSGNIWGIGYATSPDGIRWTKHAGNPVLRAGSASWEAGGVADPTILKEGSQYTMFYDAANSSQQVFWIGRAVSADGITWVRDTLNNPVLSPGPPSAWDDGLVLQPEVQPVGNRLWMWYTGYRVNLDFRRIGMASSLDGGRTWAKHAQNPVIIPGPSGSWDASLVEAGCVLRLRDTLHMWHGAARTAGGVGIWKIGHAFVPPPASDVAERGSGTPHFYALEQNYPNPFNPVTTIGYGIPRSGYVSLRVYDLLGREVAVLVDGVEEVGYRSVTFDASSLASGIYLYRLSAGEFTQTRKLAVVR